MKQMRAIVIRIVFTSVYILVAACVTSIATGGYINHRLEAAADEATPPSPKTCTLTRQIPREAGCDLIVAGGGPVGTAAAVCAARSATGNYE